MGAYRDRVIMPNVADSEIRHHQDVLRSAAARRERLRDAAATTRWPTTMSRGRRRLGAVLVRAGRAVAGVPVDVDRATPGPDWQATCQPAGH